jgi:hypothetical protein
MATAYSAPDLTGWDKGDGAPPARVQELVDAFEWVTRRPIDAYFTEQSTASSTWVDLVSFSFQVPSYLPSRNLELYCEAYITTGAGELALYDGVNRGAALAISSGSYANAGPVVFDASVLSVGSATIKLQGRVTSGGGTLYARGTNRGFLLGRD